MPKLTRVCIGCEEPLRNGEQLCGLCFVQNTNTKLLGSCIMSKLQFLITDTAPKDLVFPTGISPSLLEAVQASRLMILLRFDSKYLGGIVALRGKDPAALYLHYAAVPLPLSLMLFLLVLSLDVAIKGGEQEVYISIKLATLFEEYCKRHLSLDMIPKFLTTEPRFKNLILRDLNVNFYEVCGSMLENEFNELTKSAEFAGFLEKWNNLSYSK
jgi:hypothetical protein